MSLRESSVKPQFEALVSASDALKKSLASAKVEPGSTAAQVRRGGGLDMYVSYNTAAAAAAAAAAVSFLFLFGAGGTVAVIVVAFAVAGMERS